MEFKNIKIDIKEQVSFFLFTKDKTKQNNVVMYSCFPIGILLFIYNINKLTNVSGSMYYIVE